MIANNNSEEPDVDIVDLQTDQYPALSETAVLMAQEAGVLNGARAAPAESKEPSEVSPLHGKRQSVETEFKQRETQITLLHEELRTRETTIARLTADLQRDAAALAAADERLESKDAELAILDAERRARDERIDRQSKELADAAITHKDTLEKLARAEGEVACLNDLVRLEQDMTAAVAKRNQQMLAEHGLLQCKIQDLEIYIDGRHDQWSALNAELAALKGALLDVEKTVKERDAVIAHHDEEKRQLAASIHDLEHKCSELAGRRKELEEAHDELQRKLAAHVAQAEQVRIEYASRTKETELAAKIALGKRVDDLEKGLADREQQLQMVRDDLRVTREQRRLAQEQLSERTAQLASTQEALDQQSRHAEQLSTEQDAAQRESARIRADHETLSAHAAELGRLRGEAVAETEQLKLALKAEQELVAKLEAELRAKRATAEMLEHSLPLHDEPNRNVVDNGERIAILDSRKLVVTIDGRSFDYPILKKHMTIGRSQGNDIRIASGFVSRVHATVSTDGTSTIIEDAGSKNGVLVNSERVVRRVLHDGDVVTVSDDSSLRFVDATH